MSFTLRNAQLSQTLYLGDQPITATEVTRLDPNRTVYRVKIEPFGDLPQTIIVKNQKEGWLEEFQQEIQAYEKLKKLQGTVIPQFFGQGFFNGFPALILSEVIGITLYDLARSKSDIQEDILKTQLEKVFNLISEYGAVYWDQKVDNFLFCEDENCGDGKVMIVDLEQVQFPDKFRSWELEVNPDGAYSLMTDFTYIRRPNRGPSPVHFWVVKPGDCKNKNTWKPTEPRGLANLKGQGENEVSKNVAA
ncbi:unnamed protein product [Penicillium glandicola]